MVTPTDERINAIEKVATASHEMASETNRLLLAMCQQMGMETPQPNASTHQGQRFSSGGPRIGNPLSAAGRGRPSEGETGSGRGGG
jgi:hypothetical protein